MLSRLCLADVNLIKLLSLKKLSQAKGDEARDHGSQTPLLAPLLG